MHLCVLLKSDSRLRRWLCLACLPEWLTVVLLCVALWCLVPEWPNGKKTNQDFVLHFVTTLLIWSFNFNCFYCICVTFSAESLKQKNGSVRTSRSLSKFELGHYLLRRAPVLSINFEKNVAFLQMIIAFFKTINSFQVDWYWNQCILFAEKSVKRWWRHFFLFIKF